MCTSPSVAIRLGVSHKTGKNIIKLYRDTSKSLFHLKQVYGHDNVLLLPCGHCAECLLAKRREWSVRCACEALDHDRNCFVTLTYDDLHLNRLNREDPLKFIKAIRNSGFQVRYYGCAERGEHTLRPHYHIVLFGFMPEDLEYDGDSKSGQPLYTSKFLDKLWKKGRVAVQFFDSKYAGYVAGYTSKKLGDPEAFTFMSTKPGIGYKYIHDHKDIMLKYGNIFGDFGFVKKSAIPRYFKKILEKHGYGFYLDLISEEKLKKASTLQYKKARDHGLVRIEEAIFYNDHFATKKLQKMERTAI